MPVKGDVIKQRDTITRANVNYRALDALNCSMIKLFDSDPVKFFEQFKLGRKRKESKGTSLIIGDLVDFYLLDCQADEDIFNVRFDEKFALYEGHKGSGQVYELADALFEVTQEGLDDNGQITTAFDIRFTEAVRRVQINGKYKGKAEDKILEDFYKNGFGYFQSLLDNIGKTVLDVSLLDKSKKVADILIHDEFTRDIFQDNNDEVEYFPKFPIEWISYCGTREVKCKSEIDILKIDHGKKIIYLKDLKTTYDNESFEANYLKNKYYLQAAFYYMAAEYWAEQEGMKDYTIEPMEFVVGDTSSNNRRPVRKPTDMKDMMAGRHGFTYKGVYYKGAEELMGEICWAEENNIWNASKLLVENNGILKLDLKYD